ncbi:MAG: mercury(II) reductase [Rhizobiales bacterium]|nr:mercury(II) reductase [Hyphomicrobiales bacterium]
MSDSSTNKQYDLAVIGAGSAGFSAAITAADAGAQVVIIGHGTIGGTCVNVGCVPSKALIRAVEPIFVAQHSSRFDGIEMSAKVTDWQAVIKQKQALVDDLRKAKYSDLLLAYDAITYLEGKAAFNEDAQLIVNEKVINAKKIIIATGTRPSMPSIEGIEDIPYLDSTTALEQTTLPKSLIIIGAGYISAEIAQMFARAGVKVTIVSRRGLLPEAEPEIGSALTGYFADEGITIIKDIVYKHIEQINGAVNLHLQDTNGTRIITAEQVMIASGRTPNTDQLNLKAAGIETTNNAGVKIDPQMRTTRKNIYAAGDVTGNDQFVYMAAYGAKNALNSDELTYDNSAMPAVVFTDPQVASVGYTEAQARAAGFEVKTSILSLDNVPRALAARDTRGLFKLIADAKTKKLLGAHIMAPEGADSIQTAALAIKMGMTYEALGSMIFPYLTTVEGLKLAAQTFDMDVKKLSCCAG